MTALGLTAGYLSAISFTNLSIAGRAEERTSGALAKADTMFHCPQAPWWPNNSKRSVSGGNLLAFTAANRKPRTH